MDTTILLTTRRTTIPTTAVVVVVMVVSKPPPLSVFSFPPLQISIKQQLTRPGGGEDNDYDQVEGSAATTSIGSYLWGGLALIAALL